MGQRCKMPRSSGDLLRDEIVRFAEETIASYGGAAKVYFKFTCGHCGTRCTLKEANTLYEKGECVGCGKETVIERAGFLLVIESKKIQDVERN